MKKTVYIPEILEKISNTTKKQEKIDILHEFGSVKGFKEILFLTYDPTLEWIVTREDIESLRYQPMDIGDYDMAPSNMFLDAPKRFFNYTNFRQPALKKEKALKLIANHFSVYHHDEVEIFKQMVSGKLQAKGLTESLVREAFPGYLYDRPEQEKESLTTE